MRISWLEILAIVGIIGFVIYQQIAGQKIQVGQAAVIAARAMLAGIPFAPQKDGRMFVSGASGDARRDWSARY